MLFVALVPSLILLVLVNLAVRGSKVADAAFKVGVVLAGVMSACNGLMMLPPLLLEAGGLALAWLLWRRRQRVFLPVSLLVSGAVWGLALAWAYSSQVDYARMREELAFKSMEDRLPARPTDQPAPRLSAATNDKLSTIDRYDLAAESFGRPRYHLRQLHE